jgi:hypothetical protein
MLSAQSFKATGSGRIRPRLPNADANRVDMITPVPELFGLGAARFSWRAGISGLRLYRSILHPQIEFGGSPRSRSIGKTHRRAS